MSDQASDVTKALAAFGSPAIRYHSFGQSAARPSGAAPLRRVNWPTRPPEQQPAAERVQQAGPVVAPELGPGVPPHTTAHPAWQETPQPAPLPSPDVAAPPKPLAEWAVPVTMPVTMLLGSAMMPQPRLPPAFPQPEAAPPAAMAALPLAHAPSVAPPSLSRPDTASVVYPLPCSTMAPSRALAPVPVTAKQSAAGLAGSVGLSPASTLPEIFDFLASATSRNGASRR